MKEGYYLAVTADSLGAPAEYQIKEQLRTPLNPGQVRLAVAAAGVSFVDVLIAAGRYQIKPATPFVPGTECSGTIIEVADDIGGLTVGSRVAAGCGIGGAFAQEVVLNASSVIPIPNTMAFTAAATSYVSYQTACHALVQRADVKPGETVLVLGASGGVGAAMIEVARALGATVLASASNPEKLAAAAALGASHGIDSHANDWREQVRALTNGRGPDVIVDPVGGDETERAFRTLAWNGRHLVIGFAAGAIPSLRTNLPLLKGGSLVGVDIRQFREREPELSRANIDMLNRMIASGDIAPAATHVFPLERYADAMGMATERGRVGRIALTVDQ